MAAGAEELDIVITRQHVLAGNWEALFDEVSAYREACGEAHLKTILATGELGLLPQNPVGLMSGSRISDHGNELFGEV